MIREAINYCFHNLIHEIHKFNGTSELLFILSTIISGFSVPPREEHVIFFKSVLIPLYKVQTSDLFFDNLKSCSISYLKKDNTLAFPLLEGILKYWPFANFMKETLFIQEIQQLLEYCDADMLGPLIPKLFKRIVRCIAGSQLGSS